MIRVLVADDHAVVRRGIRQILEDIPDVRVSGEASTGREVLRSVSQHDYDLIVLDIAMPQGDGLETLKQLQEIRPDLPVLILSMYPEQQYAVRTLRAGAAGYLTKESAPDELIAAVRRVVQGGKYVTQSLMEKVLDALSLDDQRLSQPHDMLSDREYQVLRLIGAGNRVTDIARALSLSPKTISTYRARILEKLDLKSTAEMIRYCYEHRLLE